MRVSNAVSRKGSRRGAEAAESQTVPSHSILIDISPAFSAPLREPSSPDRGRPRFVSLVEANGHSMFRRVHPIGLDRPSTPAVQNQSDHTQRQYGTQTSCPSIGSRSDALPIFGYRAFIDADLSLEQHSLLSDGRFLGFRVVELLAVAASRHAVVREREILIGQYLRGGSCRQSPSVSCL